MKRFSAFLADDGAATSVEYALIAACIGLVIISALTSTGAKTSKTFSKITSALS